MTDRQAGRAARSLAVAASILFALSGIASAEGSCEADMGAADAAEMVDQCLEVSLATNPPCNAENPCDLIIDEIVRSCEMLGSDAPDFCEDYAS